MKDQHNTTTGLEIELLALKMELDALKTIKKTDVTDRSLVDQALKVSETRYRRLFETAKDGILILDAETGKIIDVNPFLIDLLGYSKEQFIEKAIWEIGFFKDVVANFEKFIELQQNEYVRYEDLPLETADGRTIHVEFVSNVYPEGDHNVIQCNIRNITDRKKIEAQMHRLITELEESRLVMIGMIEDQKRTEGTLRENEIRLYTLLQTIPDLVWLKDTEGVYLLCNKMFERFFGAKEADIIGKTDYHFIEQELADFFRAHDKKAIMTGKPTTNEEWITFADDGRRAFLETIKSPMHDSNGTLIGVLGIGRDLTRRKNVEDELIVEKKHAEESDRLKSAFLANMSHEIRTPMNGILGFAELLKEPDLTGAEQQKYLSIIERSGARMLNIINDIISISKVESGQMEVTLSETNVNDQVEFIFQFFKREVEQKGLHFSFKNSLSAKEATIRTDREKIYAILTNLVKNAIKFTEAGFIEFGYEKKGKYLEFFVKDTGIGICKEKLEVIFERFIQGSESLTRNYEGAGLGLSIAKAYVELLDGKIWVKSKEEKGSEFYFTIPCSVGVEQEDVFANDALPVEMADQIKHQKILIVEDDEVSEMLISIAIQQNGREIITVRNGIDAVEACRNNADIDLVLMDMRMPGMDGYNATREIRQFNKKVVIIAQTAFGLSGDREKALEAGCNEYITKPFKKVALLALLNSFLQIKKN